MNHVLDYGGEDLWCEYILRNCVFQDCFFIWWGKVFKDNIYQDNSGTIAALMAAITEKIQEITQEEYII